MNNILDRAWGHGGEFQGVFLLLLELRRVTWEWYMLNIERVYLFILLFIYCSVYS